MEDRYGRYVASEAYRDSRRRKAAVVAHLCGDRLRGSSWIADLGAGTGIIKKELERVTDTTICGFDLDRTFIVEGSRMAVADVLRLPIAANRFDFVLMNHLYEHVSDQAGLFSEAYRVLAPGGWAYVSAGSRWAVMEPHYRLPFLSWLPRLAAGAYVRATGRGESYEDIHFLTYRQIVRLIRAAGFLVHDITERAIDELIERTWGARWAGVWKATLRIPAEARKSLLITASPQWFFLLQKPPRV